MKTDKNYYTPPQCESLDVQYVQAIAASTDYGLDPSFGGYQGEDNWS